MQGPCAPLREYMCRFNKEKILIPYCLEEIQISTFRKGLRKDSDLYKELTKTTPPMMEGVLVLA